MTPAVSFPDVDAGYLNRLRRLCRALPEVEELPGRPGHTFRIRRRIFAHLFAVTAMDGTTSEILVCRAAPDEVAALAACGHPYFVPRGAERVGVVLEACTDWAEIAELVADSYRILASRRRQSG